MSNKTKAAPPAEKTAEGRKIPIEKLRRGCVNLFGVTPSTFDGATVGIPAGSKFTVEEMQAHIDKWLNTPVSLGRRKEG
ncbi:hypothetical protein [uncultured Oscillibacter sp.]|uniref:hypothetical protein n=1 Tax=uncultured Oscillibacter sp. TaxID=876091 RepID=UPI0025E6126C|nr:hypothetical protein [uncultured Oscillibacter sp.]